MITDEINERAYKAACLRPNGEISGSITRGDMQRALTAVLPMIRAEVLEEQRKRFTDPHAADWYWRDLDPDTIRALATEVLESRATIEAQAARIEVLEGALRTARADMQAWQGYASDYFRDKWDAAGDLAKIDAALGGNHD